MILGNEDLKKEQPNNVWSFCRRQAKQNRKKHYISEYKSNEISPVPLVRKMIESFSKEGDIILDPFAGTGTTGIESVLMKRKSICIEFVNDLFDIMLKNITKNRFNNSQITAINGDAFLELPKLKGKTMDSIITFPPRRETPLLSENNDKKLYAKINSKKDGTHYSGMVNILKECHKLLKDDGIVAIVAKNSVKKGKVENYFSYFVEAFKEAGFELVDLKFLEIKNRSIGYAVYSRKCDHAKLSKGVYSCKLKDNSVCPYILREQNNCKNFVNTFPLINYMHIPIFMKKGSKSLYKPNFKTIKQLSIKF